METLNVAGKYRVELEVKDDHPNMVVIFTGGAETVLRLEGVDALDGFGALLRETLTGQGKPAFAFYKKLKGASGQIVAFGEAGQGSENVVHILQQHEKSSQSSIELSGEMVKEMLLLTYLSLLQIGKTELLDKTLNLLGAPEPKVEARPEPKVEARPEPKVEARPEPKVEARPEPKVEVRPEPKVEVRPEPKVEVRPEPKVEARPEPKVEARPEPKVEVRPEPKVEVRPLVDYPEVRRPVVPVPRPAPAGSAVTPAQKLPSPAPKKVIGVDDILEGSLDF